MRVRNAVWLNHEQSAIRLEIEHPVYGWVPFIAMPTDTEKHGRELFEAGATGEYPVDEYQEPDKEVVA